MYWRMGEPHGLRHTPYTALVTPRPIGWISTYHPDGHPNVAPYSFFNMVSYMPPQLIVSISASPRGPSAPRKDTLSNILSSGCFVANIATWDLRDAMNRSAVECPPETDEFALAGVTPRRGRLVDAPCVAESPIHFECRLVTTLETKALEGGRPSTIVLGEVVGIFIDDEVIEDGMIRYDRVRSIARLGYTDDYAATTDLFKLERAVWTGTETPRNEQTAAPAPRPRLSDNRDKDTP